MESWKHLGAILTGVAALLTASIPLFSFLKETQNKHATSVQKLTEEVAPKSFNTDKNIFLINQNKDSKRQFAFIDDPDGWVNLRTKPTISAQVLTKIENGYRVEILERSGNWYKVKTYIDDIGYIYSDRLQLQK